MKTLSLERPLILVLVGLPGAGKSFFARQFSETFGAPVVNYGRLQFELFENPTGNAQEQELIERLAQYQIEELCKSKRTFMVDGGHNSRASRVRLRQAAQEAGYDTLIIWVQTHPSTAEARATKRNPRRTDDQYERSITNEQFATLAKKLSVPQREDYVVISGMHTYSTQAKAVLRKLASHHKAEAETAHKAERGAELQQSTRPKPTRRNVIIR